MLLGCARFLSKPVWAALIEATLVLAPSTLFRAGLSGDACALPRFRSWFDWLTTNGNLAGLS
jgi:hypothetical protein